MYRNKNTAAPAQTHPKSAQQTRRITVPFRVAGLSATSVKRRIINSIIPPLLLPRLAILY